MALYFYFNEATGDLVYSDQASYAEEGYTALGEQTKMNPQDETEWIYNSNRSSIETVSKDPASGRIVGLTSMQDMFRNCSSLASLDLSGFDTSQVTRMVSMFNNCTSLASLNLSSFDTSQVRYIGSMFKGCSSLVSLDLSGLDTSKVTDMRQTFQDCTSLASLDLSGFDTSQVTHISNMFYGCSSLASLDLSGFDTSLVTDMTQMFANTPRLARIHIGPGYTIGMPAPGSSVAGRDGRWHAIGGASYPPNSVPRVDAVYYAAADLVPDGSLLVNLEDLKAALANRGGLPLSEDTVIAEIGGKPVWTYMADSGNGLPGFVGRIEEEGAWELAEIDPVTIALVGNLHDGFSEPSQMAIGMTLDSYNPTILFMKDNATAVLEYQDGMPVLSAMGENGPVMAGDHPYGFATYATMADFRAYMGLPAE